MEFKIFLDFFSTWSIISPFFYMGEISFGPGLPYLTQVGPVSHCLALMGSVWLHLASFGPIWSRLPHIPKKKIFCMEKCHICVNLYSWPYKITLWFIILYKSTNYGQGMCSFATNLHKFVLVYCRILFSPWKWKCLQKN